MSSFSSFSLPDFISGLAGSGERLLNDFFMGLGTKGPSQSQPVDPFDQSVIDNNLAQRDIIGGSPGSLSPTDSLVPSGIATQLTPGDRGVAGDLIAGRLVGEGKRRDASNNALTDIFNVRTNIGELFSSRSNQLNSLQNPFTDELRSKIEEQLFKNIEKDKQAAFEQTRNSLLSRGTIRGSTAISAANNISGQAINAKTQASTSLFEAQANQQGQLDRFKEGLLSQLIGQQGLLDTQLTGLSAGIKANNFTDPDAINNILSNVLSASTASDFNNKLFDFQSNQGGINNVNEGISLFSQLIPSIIAPSSGLARAGGLGADFLIRNLLGTQQGGISNGT